MLSQRVRELKPSPTLVLVTKAKELAAQGHDVISLSVGEPDWPTYDSPVKAGIDAIKEGFTQYTAASGMPELRAEIAKQISGDLGLSYEAKHVTVGAGAKFMIHSALQALVDPGDEVIIPSPYWVSYPAMVGLAGGDSKIVECGDKDSFKLSAEAFKKAISNKTKVLLLNSPSNPTGLFYSKEELSGLAQVLKENPQIYVISDDIYNRLVLVEGDEVAPHLLQVAPELRDRVININGVSKSYSMTGWRIGWAVGEDKLIAAMSAFQSQAMGCPPSISQRAALAAIRDCDPDIRNSITLLKQRSQHAVDRISQIAGMDVAVPEGAFYLWANIEGVLGKTYKGSRIDSSRSFAQILLEEYHVALVPGEEFGSPGYLRLSFAIESDRMDQAIGRMADFVSQLS